MTIYTLLWLHVLLLVGLMPYIFIIHHRAQNGAVWMTCTHQKSGSPCSLYFIFIYSAYLDFWIGKSSACYKRKGYSLVDLNARIVILTTASIYIYYCKHRSQNTINNGTRARLMNNNNYYNNGLATVRPRCRFHFGSANRSHVDLSSVRIRTLAYTYTGMFFFWIHSSADRLND